MSLSNILIAQTKNENWSHLYANRVETKNFEADTVVIDSLDVTDLNVSGDAIISGVNYKTINGVGTNGQVLTSNGLGDVLWETNAGGDVSGPVSSVNDNIATFNGVNGKVIKDSGVEISNLALLNTDVFFNSVTTTGAIETDGAQLVCNDGIAAGSAVIYLQSAGVTQKAIQLNSNNLEFVNSAFNNICLMNESKNTEFFGDVKVDGVLTSSMSTSYNLCFGGDVDAANKYANFNGDASGATINTLAPDNTAICPKSSNVRNISYNTTAGDATTQLQIVTGGLTSNITLAAASGALNGLSFAAPSGGAVHVRHIAGTAPGICNIVLNFGG